MINSLVAADCIKSVAVLLDSALNAFSPGGVWMSHTLLGQVADIRVKANIGCLNIASDTGKTIMRDNHDVTAL